MANYGSCDFSYVPCRLKKMPLNKLKEHDYFGADFVAGKMSWGLFKTQKGSYIAVASYSNWNDYDVKPGQDCTFEHTQTMRYVHLTYLGALTDPAEAEDTSRKVLTWTLK